MTTQQFFKSNLFKVFLVMFIAVCLINIFKSGYSFGQWLYQALH